MEKICVLVPVELKDKNLVQWYSESSRSKLRFTVPHVVSLYRSAIFDENVNKKNQIQANQMVALDWTPTPMVD